MHHNSMNRKDPPDSCSPRQREPTAEIWTQADLLTVCILPGHVNKQNPLLWEADDTSLPVEKHNAVQLKYYQKLETL